jgi:signal transduction histidine kinase
MGLGLYTARQIVEAHGGTLTVSSQLRAGSTFSIVIPVEEKK